MEPLEEFKVFMDERLIDREKYEKRQIYLAYSVGTNRNWLNYEYSALEARITYVSYRQLTHKQEKSFFK